MPPVDRKSKNFLPFGDPRFNPNLIWPLPIQLYGCMNPESIKLTKDHFNDCLFKDAGLTINTMYWKWRLTVNIGHFAWLIIIKFVPLHIFPH
jgi:hypothetical protein